MAKYPLDRRRVEALMQEAGYRKGADGFYESPSEGRLLFQVKGTPSAENAAERAVLAAGWRQAGLDTEEATLTPAETQDGQTRATFRSITNASAPAGVVALGLYTSGTIPRPDNRWVGSNRGGWSNPEYDRFVDAVQSTLDPNERGRVIIQAVKILTEEVGTISLFFTPWVHAMPSAVQGINRQAPEADPTWNLYQWELR